MSDARTFQIRHADVFTPADAERHVVTTDARLRSELDAQGLDQTLIDEAVFEIQDALDEMGQS